MKTKSKTDVLKRETEDQTTAIKKLLIPDDGGKLFSSASDFREYFLLYWTFIFGKNVKIGETKELANTKILTNSYTLIE